MPYMNIYYVQLDYLYLERAVNKTVPLPSRGDTW